MDETIDTESADAGFSIVGLGASAGGLGALREFFGAAANDSGVAFVVVTHQHKDNPGMMPALLQSRCSMPVVPLDAATQVQPNHVYVALPGTNVGISGGFLIPVEEETHLPIDYFFRSLAQDRRDLAIGVVLSGTGTDGTLGLKEIKGASGMVMAQDEASAQFTGMPQSAISTDMVDFVAPASELPALMTRFLRTRHGASPPGIADLNTVLLMLRNRTGHDFTQYKRSTMQRRVERRMGIHHLQTAGDYVAFVKSNPGELDLLFKELLIGVTSFFRDLEAFDALQERVITQLVSARAFDDVIRIWVAGCSTGEEVYSIAMLLIEEIEQQQATVSIQIFATDLDPEAISIARAGRYPESITVDVGPERLERFFVREADCYCVRKDLREMVVFAAHNILDDPPFTRLDLLCCRNLLIYLDTALQERLLRILHYALADGGFLMVGASETLGSSDGLFDPIEARSKIFARRAVPPGSYVAEFGKLAGRPRPSERRATFGDSKASRAVERVLLDRLAPPSVLIQEGGEIVHIHGRTGSYLEPAPGFQRRNNIFNMGRDGLGLQLTSVVRRALDTETALQRGVRVRTNGAWTLVDIRAQRLARPDAFRGLFLISFENPRPDAAPADPTPADDAHADLGRQLERSQAEEQRIWEELESTNEELKLSNEELQSTNEELMSANEELQTSKEEMQSLNEELQTVNTELHTKVEELSLAHDDMKNLLNGTDIATVFLDGELRIKRFTDQAKRFIRLISSDIGRSIADLAHALKYEGLVADATEVLRTLHGKEAEVQSEDGSWLFMRILPYRTTSNVIHGVVITFIDISTLKRVQESERRLVATLASSPTTMFGQDADLHYTWVTRELFQIGAERVVGRHDSELLGEAASARLTELKQGVLATGRAVRESITLSVRGSETRIDLYAATVLDEGGAVAGICGLITDLEAAR